MRTNEIVDNPYQKINLLPLLHRYFRGPVRIFEQPFAMILVVEQADIRTRWLVRYEYVFDKIGVLAKHAIVLLGEI